MRNDIPVKIYIPEEELPKCWVDMRPILKDLPPMLSPKTGKPCTEEDLKGVFCDAVIKQELNTTEAYIAIPEEIRAFYSPFLKGSLTFIR